MKLTFGWMTTSISKTAAFGLKIILKPLFDAVTSRKTYCLVCFMVWRNHWPLLLQKRCRSERYCQWWPLQRHDQGLLRSWIASYECGAAVVSTKRRNMSHSASHNQFIEENVWWAHYFAFWICELASNIVRFNTARLFPVGVCKVTSISR